jgi:uncharacterized protein
MKCPACGQPLSEIKTGSIHVQACQNGCGGLWVNHLQMEKINKPDEYDGEILTHLQNKRLAPVDVNRTLHCPHCADRISMMRHFFSVKRNVTVNECPECGGYWLNMGELLKIRQTWKTDEQREKAAEDYFSALFGYSFSQDKTKDEGWETKAHKVYDLFKYICPSHHFKDQKWSQPYV